MPFKGIMPAPALVPKPYGLFSVAIIDEVGARDEHWGQGFDAMSEACSFDTALIDICSSFEEVASVNLDGARWKRIRPFGITVTDKCLVIGETMEERRERALRQLGFVTQKAVEQELWVGGYRSSWDAHLDGIEAGSSIPQGYLSHQDTTVLQSDPQSPIIALALLEQAHADNSPGTQGVVHVSPLIGSILGSSGGFEKAEDGDYLLTKAGNKLVIGAGYDGSGPDATADSDFIHWMYITGQVKVVLGSEEMVTVNPAEAVNVKTNEVTFKAERPAAVYTDGCEQFAVSADIRL